VALTLGAGLAHAQSSSAPTSATNATGTTSESPSAASIKSLQSRDAKEPAARDPKDQVAATKTATAPNAKDAAVTATLPRQRRPVLRCWQEGRLVFEGSGVLPSAQGQAAIELRNASGTALQVFDLKNGLCLLDYGNE
jgi:CCR4-NOT transcriptional regulation complex NOT5 subunit